MTTYHCPKEHCNFASTDPDICPFHAIECVPRSPHSGVKHDHGKPRWDLLPWGQVEDIVKVLTFGAQKYADGVPDSVFGSAGDNNWQSVEHPTQRYFAAAMRHITANIMGEKLDPESGLPHLAHAGCCLLFMAWFDNATDAGRGATDE